MGQVDEVKERIKNHFRLEDIINSTEKLAAARAGARYCRGVNHDSLVVNTERQFYHWNSKGESGDVISWVMARYNWDFPTALEQLALQAGLYDALAQAYKADGKPAKVTRPAPVVQLSSCPLDWTTENKPVSKGGSDTPPDSEWQKVVKGIVLHFHQVLLTEAGAAPLKWLANRGITEATASHWQLGYNPEGKQFIASKCVYGGLLIPHFQPSTGILWGVKIRLSKEGANAWLLDHPLDHPKAKKAPKYTSIGGSKSNLFNADSLTRQQSAIVTEGELDTILLAQELDGLAGVVTLCSASGRLGDSWLPIMLAVRRYYLALDNDRTGVKALEYWQALVGKRGHLASVPTGKDVSEYWQQGGNLRQWAAGFLPGPAEILTSTNISPAPAPASFAAAGDSSPARWVEPIIMAGFATMPADGWVGGVVLYRNGNEPMTFYSVEEMRAATLPGSDRPTEQASADCQPAIDWLAGVKSGGSL